MSQRSLLKALGLVALEIIDGVIESVSDGTRYGIMCIHEAIEDSLNTEGLPGWVKELRAVRADDPEEPDVDSLSPDGLRALADALEEEDDEDDER